MFCWNSLRTELQVKISGSLLPESPKEDHHLNYAFLLPDAFHESSDFFNDHCLLSNSE